MSLRSPAPLSVRSALATEVLSATFTPATSAPSAAKASGSENRKTLSALIQPRQHELAMAQRLGGGEASVGGAEQALEQLVAGLVGRQLFSQQAGDVDVDMLGHRPHGARVG